MEQPRLRIVFMGTPSFAIPSLEALLHGPDEIVGVICQPDRAQGRSRKPVAPPVKTVAATHGLPVLQPENIRSDAFLGALQELTPDLIVVVAYGRILPATILELPRFGCINVHGSLLPRHRGAAPVQWAIIKGDDTVGVTIMQMDKGMDTGDILLQTSLSPDPEETAGSLFIKLAELGSEALMDTLDLLAQGGLATIEQDETLATYAPMLKKEDGLIDWNRSAEQIDRLIRGLDPWPTGYTFLGDRKLQLFAPQVIHEESSRSPGTILRADQDGLLLATARNCLLIREIKPEGRGRMSVAAFLNGCPIELGSRLGVPLS